MCEGTEAAPYHFAKHTIFYSVLRLSLLICNHGLHNSHLAGEHGFTTMKWREDLKRIGECNLQLGFLTA